MTSNPPEFHTKTLSPLSPFPIHPPEPANIPVLRNQTDPVFNMTSTHLDPAVTAPAEPIIPPAESSPSPDSSFSDAYKDDAEVVEKKNVSDTTQPIDEDDDDDYAMTFDSDGEENADSQDISRAINEPETMSLPTTVSDSTSSIVASLEPPAHELPNAGPPTHSPSLPSEQKVADTPAANPLDTTVIQPTTETGLSKHHSYEDIASGGIDIQQLLDNITANAEKNASTSPTATTSSSHPPNPSLSMNNSGLPPHSSLPPRPNIPLKRPYSDEPHNYYAGAPGLPPASASYRPPGGATSIIAAGAPGTSTDPRGGLPPPPSASFRGPPPSLSNPISPASYLQNNRLSGPDQGKPLESQIEADDLDAKWGPEVQKLYDAFLEDERHYVTEGLWDRFPVGSRLFIGNLPSESVTKRDLFHVFHHYGRIAQISIKQAYGFVQFHDSAACYAALQREQGTEVRDRKIHLEISKPQKNTRNADHNAASQRAKASDYSRGGAVDHSGRNRNNDRYEARPVQPMRTDEYGRPIRVRDDYRPTRQPSPPRASFRGRDEYAPRGRDSYDGRDRRRERSRSPYGYRDETRYRERSLSPRAREAIEDADLQIPRRDPRNVPDVQIILMDQLDRQFVSWVENEMRGRGIKVEVMFLSPRLPLQAVIRRQILEGVHAVSKLDMRSQNSSKIPLQVFDRQGGANNVRFDEYQDLDPKIAAELVIRAKQTQQAIHPPVFSQPQFPSGQSYQPAAPAPAPAAPNVANLVGSLDNATLQKLLSTLNIPQQQNAPAVAANSTIDLAGLLGGLQGQAPPQGYVPPPTQPTNPYSNAANNAALASLLGNGTQQQPALTQPQQSAQQVQNIMAQLAKFRQ